MEYTIGTYAQQVRQPLPVVDSPRTAACRAVGAYEVVQQFDVAYGDGPQNAYVAVATGGSQNIDRNVEVVLTHNDATIEWYNNNDH